MNGLDDIGFIIALLLLFLGVERFALRPHQRDDIQELVEAFTVNADDFSSAKISHLLNRPEVIRFLSFTSYFYFCLILIITLVIAGASSRLIDSAIYNGSATGLRAAVCFLSLLIVSRWPVPQLLHKAFGDNPTFSRLLTYALVGFYGGSILLLSLLLLTNWLIFGSYIVSTNNSPEGLYLELVYWPMYIIMWLSVATLTLALLSYRSPPKAQWVFRIFVGWLWRVVEYEKGAFSALVFILAFVLALIKLVNL